MILTKTTEWVCREKDFMLSAVYTEYYTLDVWLYQGHPMFRVPEPIRGYREHLGFLTCRKFTKIMPRKTILLDVRRELGKIHKLLGAI